MLRRECDVDMRVTLLLNISRDVASASNMVPIAVGRDGWKKGEYNNVLVTAYTQWRDGSIHTMGC